METVALVLSILSSLLSVAASLATLLCLRRKNRQH